MWDWKPQSGAHAGSDILIPTLLPMLEHEGIFLRFPSRSGLTALHTRILEDFNSQVIYSNVQSPALRLSKAFLDCVECDRFSPLNAHRGIMGSLSSKAAYLIGFKRWDGDENSETYLRTARGGSWSHASNVPILQILRESIWDLVYQYVQPCKSLLPYNSLKQDRNRGITKPKFALHPFDINIPPFPSTTPSH